MAQILSIKRRLAPLSVHRKLNGYKHLLLLPLRPSHTYYVRTCVPICVPSRPCSDGTFKYRKTRFFTDLAGETKLPWIQFSTSLEEKKRSWGLPYLSCWIFPSQAQNLEGSGECGEDLKIIGTNPKSRGKEPSRQR